jgi:hypothetical protein
VVVEFEDGWINGITSGTKWVVSIDISGIDGDLK